MKAKIDKDKVLAIIPETIKEDKELHEWYIKNKDNQVNHVILFERKRKK